MLIKKYRPRQDSNLQSPDPKSGAFSIRPHGLMLCIDSILYTIQYEISDESHGNMLQGMLQFILHI